jgi:GNAT superfamily N-acetyltransferase
MARLAPEEVAVRSATGDFDGFRSVVSPGRAENGCWCMSYRDARLDGAERARYMAAACARAPGPGVLAYVAGTPVGWCSVAPRSTYRRLMHSRTIPVVDDRDPWAIVCFVVTPGFRHRGLMGLLLGGAESHAREFGAEVLEAYPVDSDVPGRVDSTAGYVGTTRLFEGAGFTRITETTSHSGGRVRWLMRKELSDPRAR